MGFVDDGSHDLAGELVQPDAFRTVQTALVDQLDQIGTLAVQVPDRSPGTGRIVHRQCYPLPQPPVLSRERDLRVPAASGESRAGGEDARAGDAALLPPSAQ